MRQALEGNKKGTKMNGPLGVSGLVGWGGGTDECVILAT